MHSDHFLNLDYLKSGNPKQKDAFEVLQRYQVFHLLRHFNPLLAGTVPIDIAIENSDLDILCHFTNADDFEKYLNLHCSGFENYEMRQAHIDGHETRIANFILDNWPVEIFGQTKPSHHQNAYKHMVVEHELLLQHGEDFRLKIIELKKQGYKTEPAFAMLLGLKGNPYEALLDMFSAT